MAKSRAQKRTEAKIRQAEYDALSTKQKVQRALRARGQSKKQLRKLNKNNSQQV